MNVTTDINLSQTTYTRGELINITNGATLTINTTPTIRPGTIQCVTKGKLVIENTNVVDPLILELDDQNNDIRIESLNTLEIKGELMLLDIGNDLYKEWDFNILFGGKIKDITYVLVEEDSGSDKYLPWPIISKDPKFNLNSGQLTLAGGADSSYFTAGNTIAGRALFWNETTRKLSTGNGTNGSVIKNGCKVKIPNIYISNRLSTNSSRAVALTISGTPSAGSFNIAIQNEDGSPLGITGNINYNASNTEIKQIIETITGVNTVNVANGPLPNVKVTLKWAGGFTSGFGNIPRVSINDNNLTGGTNPQAYLHEDATGNMSLLDLAPLGILKARNVSFSNKFRVIIDNFLNIDIKDVGFGGDAVQFNSSNGDIYIDGMQHTQGPFTLSATTQVASIYGKVRLQRIVGLNKNSGSSSQSKFTFSILPNLELCDEIIGGFYSPRQSTSNRSIQYVTLPENIIIKNTAGIGGPIYCQNLLNSKFINPKVADSTTNTQLSSIASNGFTFSNCINPIVYNIKNAGPSVCRGDLITSDEASTNIQVYNVEFDAGNNNGSPIYLGSIGSKYQNMKISNVRAGPFVNTISNYLAKNNIIRKTFCTFATPQIVTGLDAASSSVYDLVTSEKQGLTVTFEGVTDFVGGNYTDPGFNPTTGHVTFGPFGDGVNLELFNGAYTDSRGGIVLPLNNSYAVATMHFTMHGITNFQNSNYCLYLDAYGILANSCFIKSLDTITGGTFNISIYDEQDSLLGKTSNIVYNASTTTVKNALEILPEIGTGVTVSGTLNTGYIIKFPLGKLFKVTADGTLLTGGQYPGLIDVVGLARLVNGSEKLGNNLKIQFSIKNTTTDWTPFVDISPVNLFNCVTQLNNYSAGTTGLDMRLKISTDYGNLITKINQISLLTDVDPDLWEIYDANIEFLGPNPNDIIKVVNFKNSEVLYTFTGGGVKEFLLNNNFDEEVYFRRELLDGTVLMRTLPKTHKLSFGNNGKISMFYGDEIQLSETSVIGEIEKLLKERLDIKVSSSSITVNDKLDIADKTINKVLSNSKTVEENLLEIKGLSKITSIAVQKA